MVPRKLTHMYGVFKTYYLGIIASYGITNSSTRWEPIPNINSCKEACASFKGQVMALKDRKSMYYFER